MSEQKAMAVFFEIHSGNAQEGPGDFESTRRAFAMRGSLPKAPEILDAGCGPGRQTLDLLRLTDGTITAVDNHGPFLEHLQRRAAEAGLARRVTTLQADMADLPFEDGTFDVIWGEGSIYNIGFDEGLKKWRRLLKPDGAVAVSELTELRPCAPEEAVAFWKGAYPVMRDIEGNVAAFGEAGYRPVGHFILPESAWWDYYKPILKKLRGLRQQYGNDPEALRIVENERIEMDFYRKYSAYYGYVFYLARKI